MRLLLLRGGRERCIRGWCITRSHPHRGEVRDSWRDAAHTPAPPDVAAECELYDANATLRGWLHWALNIAWPPYAAEWYAYASSGRHNERGAHMGPQRREGVASRSDHSSLRSH